MADTFAAVMHSHLGGSSTLDDSGAPSYWTANLSQQDPSAAFMVPAQPYLSRNATLLQQQQYQAHLASASAAAAAAAADPNAALYANYRAQHPQAFAEADRLSYGSDVSTAAVAAAAQHQQGMLAAEMAFKARQLAQLQQQQHALQQQPQQQLLLAQQAQQQQQHRSAVGAAAVPAATSALYRASSSHSSMTHHQQHPSISYSTLPQSSHYPASMQAPSTAAARLPPRPNTAHVQQYHPYHSTATGATTLEHHHHNSLAAAAAAARAAAIQQQQQCSSAPSAARQAASAAAAAAGAAAALQHGGNAGRWSGAVAVLDQRILGATAGTQASGNDQHCSLECDEELLSMDGLDQDDPQQQHPQHSTEVISGSFGSKGRNISSGPAAAQLQGGSAGRPHHLLSSGLATSSAQHAAAASAAARAAAAGYAFNHLEEDDAVFDMYEDSGSTHPDSDGSSDDMDADTEPMQDQHQRRNSTSDRTGAGGSSGGQRQPGSSSGRAPAAAAAPASAQQANAAKLDAQAVSLHVLSSVANRRKGEQVLTAHPAVAEAAGARSVRTRLLITEVSLYCENAATSMLALQQSNKLLSKMSLPGKWLPSRAAVWLADHVVPMLSTVHRDVLQDSPICYAQLHVQCWQAALDISCSAGLVGMHAGKACMVMVGLL